MRNFIKIRISSLVRPCGYWSSDDLATGLDLHIIEFHMKDENNINDKMESLCLSSCHVIVWHSANLATSRSHCLQLCCYHTHATQVTSGILNIMYLSLSLRPCWGLTWGLCGQPIILKDLTVHRFTARISGGHRSNALMAHTDRRLPSFLPFPILSKKMIPNIPFRNR